MSVAAASPSDPAPPDDRWLKNELLLRAVDAAGYVLVRGEGLAHGDELVRYPLTEHEYVRRVAAAVPPGEPQP